MKTNKLKLAIALALAVPLAGCFGSDSKQETTAVEKTEIRLA
ncbi:hypothetical protein JCM19233_2061 [Vibrio astriarenae]|nr:hypothetical protein JCM19233_2061 [Vibrio sp. C7]